MGKLVRFQAPEGMIHLDPDEIVYIGAAGPNTVFYDAEVIVRNIALRNGLEHYLLETEDNRLTLSTSRPEVAFT